MATGKTRDPDLAARVEELERQYEALRRALAALSREVASQEVDELIDELADHPMSETEMEAAFDRLDAALDSPG